MSQRDIELSAKTQTTGTPRLAVACEILDLVQLASCHFTTYVCFFANTNIVVLENVALSVAGWLGRTRASCTTEKKKERSVFPSVASLLQTGIQYQQAGHYQEAESCYRQVLAAYPRHAEASYLLGGLAHQLGRGDLAVPLLRTAVASQAGEARYLSALRTVLLSQGRLEEAVNLFKEATLQFPQWAELHALFGGLLVMKYQEQEALLAYQRALELNPNLLMAHADLGMLYYKLGRIDESLAASARALGLNPNLPTVHASMGLALVKKGQFEHAIAALRRALELDPRMAPVHEALAGAYLHAADPAAALRAVREAHTSFGFLSGMLALEYLAANELGDDAAAQQLMDFERLVQIDALSVPPDFGSLVEFNSALAAEMRAHPSLLWEPALKTTRGGYLSADLAQQPTPVYRVFEQLLRTKLDDLIGKLPTDSRHPVFSRKATNYRLHVWATVLDAEGYQDSHLHAGAWLSGVYYVELPRTLGATAEDHAGWIEFGRPPGEYQGLRRPPLVQAVQPRAGSLVLFPSYFFHRTIPFPAGGQRISIAFDIVV
jgi:uncharacterized protein (TIGR02466 family)